MQQLWPFVSKNSYLQVALHVCALLHDQMPNAIGSRVQLVVVHRMEGGGSG